MSDEFELEHWKSRAKIAEKERDSARIVLASLRSFHRDPSPENAARLLARRKEHDVTWWNVNHAMAALSEAIDGIKLDRPLVARAAEAALRVVDKWVKDKKNGAFVSGAQIVTMPLRSLYNLAGMCLYLGLDPSDERQGDN